MNLIIEILRAVSYALISPTLSLMLIVVGFLFYFKNRKIAFMQKLMLGRSIVSPLELTLSQILFGIIGGILASLMLSFLGVTFENSSLVDAILIGTIFSVIYRNRFLNMPYISSFIGIIAIILGFNEKYLGRGFSFDSNITSIIALVGVFSIIEGLLTMVDGKSGYLPIFTQKDGKLIGGFSFRRFWIIPLGLLVVMGNNSGSVVINEISNFPKWLPFLSGENMASLISGVVIATIATYGVIFYDSSTFTRSKGNKIVSSGTIDIIYGIAILGLDYILKYSYVLTIILLVLIPFLYGLRIKIEEKIESNRAPLYFSGDDDICILDVLPNSLAFEKGLRSGDRIIKLNGEIPKSEKDVFMAIKKNYYGVNLEVRKNNGEIQKHTISSEDRGKLFGVILVPKGTSYDKEVNELIEKLKKASQKEKQNKEDK